MLAHYWLERFICPADDIMVDLWHARWALLDFINIVEQMIRLIDAAFC